MGFCFAIAIHVEEGEGYSGYGVWDPEEVAVVVVYHHVTPYLTGVEVVICYLKKAYSLE